MIHVHAVLERNTKSAVGRDEFYLSRTHISNLVAPNMPTSISIEKLFDISDALGVKVGSFFDFRE